jgi:hypothetical protein
MSISHDATRTEDEDSDLGLDETEKMIKRLLNEPSIIGLSFDGKGNHIPHGHMMHTTTPGVEILAIPNGVTTSDGMPPPLGLVVEALPVEYHPCESIDLRKCIFDHNFLLDETKTLKGGIDFGLISQV